MSQCVVVKLGGSLLDLPALGSRLRQWLDALPTPRSVLLVGGGATTDIIRQADRRHQLGEEAAHWLALRALSLNAHLLEALLPESEVVESLHPCSASWARRRTPILDPLPFLQEDERYSDRLPHCWAAGSDCVAARIAMRIEAGELVLLKSQTVVPSRDWAALAAEGVVDAWFPHLASQLPAVRLVNFRAERPS